MTIQPQNNKLHYLTDPKFTKVNKLFLIWSFERNAGKDHGDYFSHYHVPNVEIKDFIVLIDGKSFFDLAIKTELKVYEEIVEVIGNNDYTTGNLLGFAYFKENYRLIAIDSSKQTTLKDPQQINFFGKL